MRITNTPISIAVVRWLLVGSTVTNTVLTRIDNDEGNVRSKGTVLCRYSLFPTRKSKVYIFLNRCFLTFWFVIGSICGKIFPLFLCQFCDKTRILKELKQLKQVTEVPAFQQLQFGLIEQCVDCFVSQQVNFLRVDVRKGQKKVYKVQPERVAWVDWQQAEINKILK